MDSPSATSCVWILCTLPSILQRFQDMAGYWSNFRCLHWGTSLRRTRSRRTPKFWIAKFGHKKLKTSLLCGWSIFRYLELCRHDLWVWQTDRQTVRLHDSKSRASLRCAAKNRLSSDHLWRLNRCRYHSTGPDLKYLKLQRHAGLPNQLFTSSKVKLVFITFFRSQCCEWR